MDNILSGGAMQDREIDGKYLITFLDTLLCMAGKTYTLPQADGTIPDDMSERLRTARRMGTQQDLAGRLYDVLAEYDTRVVGPQKAARALSECKLREAIETVRKGLPPLPAGGWAEDHDLLDYTVAVNARIFFDYAYGCMQIDNKSLDPDDFVESHAQFAMQTAWGHLDERYPDRLDIMARYIVLNSARNPPAEPAEEKDRIWHILDRKVSKRKMEVAFEWFKSELNEMVSRQLNKPVEDFTKVERLALDVAVGKLLKNQADLYSVPMPDWYSVGR